ncbi:MAG: glycosyltransferase family 4 protein [Clostridiales bacterium]|nr:glycosyltransferase family 4 protein [Candidatus Crickella equi]
MRILSITAQKPHSTGSGTYLTELVNAWDRSGHDQAVVYGIYQDDCVSFPDAVKTYPVYYSNGQNAGDISFPIVGMSDVMPYESTRYIDMTDSMIKEFESAFIKQIETAIDALNPDVIVCHHLFLLTALVRKHFPDRKIIGICHGTCLRQTINCEHLRTIVQPYIRKLNHIFALHSEQVENIHEIDNISADMISIIGSGYNDSLFNRDGRIPYQPGKPVRICYAGKMSKAKGIPELLAALMRLDKDPTAHSFQATLVGGCTDSEVQALLDTLPANISWLGQIPQNELADVYRTNDIFVLPSYFEGLNLATIEAMASGLVPVCTDLPGMQDWINENVANSNVRYISMPDMVTIDTPSDAGKARYEHELEGVLRQVIAEVVNGRGFNQPDTSSISWDSVAARLIKAF